MQNVLKKIGFLLVSFLVQKNICSQNLVLNGSMTGTVGENTVASSWTISPNIPPCSGCQQNTPDLNNTGPVQTAPGYSWYLGPPVESNDGGSWQNLIGPEGIEQTISGLSIGQTYYFSFEYCSQGIRCCGSIIYASPSAPNVTIIGATGYVNPSTSGNLYNWESVTAAIVATSTSVTIIAQGGFNASYLAYDGFYLSTTPVIPIKLNNFDVSQKQNDILLIWSTDFEDNTNRFEILKSFDGLHWDKIGKVSAEGNSSIRRHYYYYDQFVSTKNYYRLKVIDFDGKYSLSKVVFLKVSQTDTDFFFVFPNPAVNNITIKFTDSYETESKLQIFNLSGQLVKELWIAPNTLQFNLSLYDLMKGHYTLKLINSKTLIKTLILQ